MIQTYVSYSMYARGSKKLFDQNILSVCFDFSKYSLILITVLRFATLDIEVCLTHYFHKIFGINKLWKEKIDIHAEIGILNI